MNRVPLNRNRLFAIGCGLAISLTLIGCAAHEKNGDRAAALGDWRTAFSEYREALGRDPESKPLKDKYDHARTAAISDATGKAKACQATGNWQCVVNEADYALSIDPTNATVAALRAAAAKEFSLALIREAVAASNSRRFAEAFEKLSRAQGLHASGTEGDLATAITEVCSNADAEGTRLAGEKKYEEAISLLTMATKMDASRQGHLDDVRRQYDEFLSAEAERLSVLGDAALAAKNWTEAERQYGAALKAKPAGRAKSLFAYASSISKAEAALGRGDFDAAAKEYHRAMESGVDPEGYATKQLGRVEVRSYRFHLRYVSVTAARPSGAPWQGPRDASFDSFIAAGATAINPVGGIVAKALLAQANAMPVENRPTLVIETALPDGRRFSTKPEQAIYSVLESSFTITTNAFDARRVALRVKHVGKEPCDIGLVETSVGELVSRRESVLSDHSVTGLQVVAERADDSVDGAVDGMSLVTDETNLAPSYSAPGPGALGYQLTTVQISVAAGDYQNELSLDGPPDPKVEVIQRGAQVYRSPVDTDSSTATWNPHSTFFFVAPNEKLEVRAWDSDVRDDDLITAFTISWAAIASGSAEFRTQRGTSVRLFFKPRNSAPTMASR